MLDYIYNIIFVLVLTFNAYAAEEAELSISGEQADCFRNYQRVTTNWASSNSMQYWSLDKTNSPIVWNHQGQHFSFACEFSETARRRDVVLTLPNVINSCQGIAFDIRADDAAAIKSSMVYVYQGNTDQPVSAGATFLVNEWQRIVLPATIFSPDNSNNFNSIRQLRLAFWGAYKSLSTVIHIRNVELFNGVNDTNLQPNGSFENADELDGWPLYWGTKHWGVSDLPWLLQDDLLNKKMYRDSSESVHGKYSMRLITSNKHKRPSKEERLTILTGNGVNNLKGDLTLSCYLKSDRPMNVEIRYGTSAKNPNIAKIVNVKPYWQHYALNVPLNKSDIQGPKFIPMDKGTIWVDAVQLERGDTATSFTTNVKDDLRLVNVIKVSSISPSRNPSVRRPLPNKLPKIETTSCGGLLINGKPFIPFGITDGGLLLDAVIPEYYSKSGFNCLVKIMEAHKVTTEEMLELFDKYTKAGIYVIPWFYGNIPEEQMVRLINKIKHHPAILFWHAYDEPNPKVTNNALQKRLDSIKKVDRIHPVIFNYASEKIFYGGKTTLRNNVVGDVIAYDYYPISENRSMVSTQEDFYELVKKAKGRLAMFFLQTAGNNYTWAREPSPAEAYVQCYGALIAGVRSFIYFANRPIHESLWDAEKALAYEVEQLTPALVLGKPYTSLKLKQQSILYTAMLHNEHLFIITVNISSKNVENVIFDTKIVGKDVSVPVWFEDRDVQLNGKGLLVDSFRPFERHVYVITCSSLNITVASHRMPGCRLIGCRLFDKFNHNVLYGYIGDSSTHNGTVREIR